MDRLHQRTKLSAGAVFLFVMEISILLMEGNATPIAQNSSRLSYRSDFNEIKAVFLNWRYEVGGQAVQLASVSWLKLSLAMLRQQLDRRLSR